MTEQSAAVKAVWAKFSSNGLEWLPLTFHMRDAAEVSKYLWDEWLSESLRDKLCYDLCRVNPETARNLVSFLAAVHDIGKASPEFQSKAEDNRIRDRLDGNGLHIGYLQNRAMPHAIVSMLIMERNGIDRSVSIVAGSHHGTPPSRDMVSRRRLAGYEDHTGFSDRVWVDLQDDLFGIAVSISGLDRLFLQSLRDIPVSCQDILTGIVIMADWIASNSDCFPFIPIEESSEIYPEDRSYIGWERMRFPHHSGLVCRESTSFTDAFGFNPRPFQSVALGATEAMVGPGIVVIEAPMGEGKTEAALMVAELFARKLGQNGLFFGLPTQATANSVFSRVHSWLERCSGAGTRSVSLAHGKSRFNDEFSNIPHVGWDVGDDGTDNVVVHEWFGGKKGMLADVVVGTVDQVLMAGLKRKHLCLRHLGLSEKVVIVDECHAYDEYMGSYLTKSLRWLGCLGVPVVLMSATLPRDTKKRMVEGYLGHSVDFPADVGYPQITCATSESVTVSASERSGRDIDVILDNIVYEDIPGILESALSEGGYAGLIFNTVRRAQVAYDVLSHLFPESEVILIHSSFTAVDRARIETHTMEILRRRDSSNPIIVVGTQVLEQSLDIDFDILITDLCPIDLLIQRIGRLHRHSNIRPPSLTEPTCFIVDSGNPGLEPGSEAVYGAYQLLNSRELLRGRELLHIPDDIPILVNAAYFPGGLSVESDNLATYLDAKRQSEDLMRQREEKAKVFQILSPDRMQNLVGWLDNERNDPRGVLAEATVRDTDGSVEVILVGRRDDGSFFSIIDGTSIPLDRVPDIDLAKTVADCRLSLPYAVLARFGMDKTVHALNEIRKNIPRYWDRSSWLSGELFMIFDDEGKADLMDMRMTYDSKRGLKIDG